MRVVGSAEGDPFFKVGDEGVGELVLLGWHFEILLFMFDQCEEIALSRVIKVDGIVGVSAFEEELAGRDIEAGADFFVAVALEAVVDEGGADGLLKEGGAGFHAFGVTSRERVRAQGQDEEKESETGRGPTHSAQSVSIRWRHCTHRCRKFYRLMDR